MSSHRPSRVHASLLTLAFVGGLLLSMGVAARAQEPGRRPSIDDLRRAAEAGAATAQLAYAEALPRTARDEATRWAKKAADQGLGAAWYWLAQNASGRDNLALYEQAVQAGDDRGFDALLDGLLFRAGADADVAKAKRYADLARTRGASLGALGEPGWSTVDRCSEAGRPVPPATDIPTEPQARALSAEECLWPGEDAGPQVRHYARCLLAQGGDAAARTTANRALAELYANGWGVTRRPDLAIAYACHSSVVPAELTSIVDLLYTTRNQKTLETAYVYCDMAMAGSTMSECASEREASSAEERDTELAQLSKGWTTAQRAAFDRLRAAATAYRDGHTEHEVHPGGTMHATLAIGAIGEFEDGLLATLKAYEGGRFPARADFAAADRDLNAAYRTLMGEDLEGSGISRDAVKDTQRAWIVYRDAWVGFAAARYPRASPDAIKTQCTRERTKALREVIEP